MKYREFPDKRSCFIPPKEPPNTTGGPKERQPAQKDQFRSQRPLERLILLLTQGRLNPDEADKSEELRRLFQRTFAQIMCDDLSPLLPKIALALNQIELSLHDDQLLQNSIGDWRRRLGRWRNILIHQSELLRELSLDLSPGVRQ